LRIQKAFVFVKVDSGEEKSVEEKLIKINEVTEVHVIPGKWDLLAILQIERDLVAPSDEKVLNLVIDKLAKISHVRDTSTLVPHLSMYKSPPKG
jgi:DNA-binding Lrp family transcriptional regulator